MIEENINRVTQEEILDSLDCLVEDGKPIIFRSDLGQCHEKWDPEYLSEKLENRTFSVHEAETTKLDFRIKNFEYKLYNGKDFIESCQKGKHKVFNIMLKLGFLTVEIGLCPRFERNYHW